MLVYPKFDLSELYYHTTNQTTTPRTKPPRQAMKHFWHLLSEFHVIIKLALTQRKQILLIIFKLFCFTFKIQGMLSAKVHWKIKFRKPFKTCITKCDLTGQVQTFKRVFKKFEPHTIFLEGYAFSNTYAYGFLTAWG